jgi:hypothetical protein
MKFGHKGTLAVLAEAKVLAARLGPPGEASAAGKMPLTAELVPDPDPAHAIKRTEQEKRNRKDKPPLSVSMALLCRSINGKIRNIQLL